jgi:hypothetical protein
MGYGQHLHHLLEEDPVNTVALGRLLIILQAIGLWTFTLPKLPVVALLVRIFSTTKRLAIVLYSMVIALILLVFVMTITTFAQCTPIERNWNPTIKVGRCWDPDINLSLGYLAGCKESLLFSTCHLTYLDPSVLCLFGLCLRHISYRSSVNASDGTLKTNSYCYFPQSWIRVSIVSFSLTPP